MATHKSAKTRIRRNARRTVTNGARRSRVRGFIRSIEEAIGKGDKKSAQEAFRLAQPELQRGVTKGVFHANTVGRKISRLNARIKAL